MHDRGIEYCLRNSEEVIIKLSDDAWFPQRAQHEFLEEVFTVLVTVNTDKAIEVFRSWPEEGFAGLFIASDERTCRKIRLPVCTSPLCISDG